MSYSITGRQGYAIGASRFARQKRKQDNGKFCSITCCIAFLVLFAIAVSGSGVYLITLGRSFGNLEEKYHFREAIVTARESLLHELHTNINLDPENTIELNHPDNTGKGDRKSSTYLRQQEAEGGSTGLADNIEGGDDDHFKQEHEAKKHFAVINQVSKKDTKQRKKRVAFAITITKDGFFQDGAAVLAYTVIKHSQQSQNNNEGTEGGYIGYEPTLVAFVRILVIFIWLCHYASVIILNA